MNETYDANMVTDDLFGSGYYQQDPSPPQQSMPALSLIVPSQQSTSDLVTPQQSPIVQASPQYSPIVRQPQASPQHPPIVQQPMVFQASPHIQSPIIGSPMLPIDQASPESACSQSGGKQSVFKMPALPDNIPTDSEFEGDDTRNEKIVMMKFKLKLEKQRIERQMSTKRAIFSIAKRCAKNFENGFLQAKHTLVNINLDSLKESYEFFKTMLDEDSTQEDILQAKESFLLKISQLTSVSFSTSEWNEILDILKK